MSAETGHAVRLIFRLFARLFPYHPPRGKEHVTLADLKPQLRGWDTKTALLLFACAPFTVWGCKAALAAIFPPPPAPAGALAHLTIDPMFFLLPGLFLGLVLAAVPVMGIVRALLGGRFEDYLLYGNLLVGFDTVKIWVALAVLLSGCAWLTAGAAAGVHLTVFNDRLELQHFGFSRPAVIPAAQVTSASADASGLLKLGFADGTAWSSADDLSLLAPTPDQARRIAARFSGR